VGARWQSPDEVTKDRKGELKMLGVTRQAHAWSLRGVAATCFALAACALSPAVAGAGPGPGGVTGSDRAAINVGNCDHDVVLSGVAQDASSATVSLDDADPSTPAVNATATLSAPSGAQTWTATLPAEDVQGLDDGTLTASATFTTASGPVAGTTLAVLKDTVAPASPTATPGAGTFPGTQRFVLRSTDPTARIHWTTGTRVDTGSPLYTGPIAVASTQTIRAVAVDGAGNAGPVAAWRLVIAARAAVVDPVEHQEFPTATGWRPAGPRLLSLSVPARLRRGELRHHGLALTLDPPAGARMVRIEIRRVGRGHRIARVERALRSTGRQRVVLRGRPLVRRLTPGRYVVEVRPGRAERWLGGATVARLRIVR
jgi:chitobiase/beta-hexosaminidase-like protein